MSTYTAGPWRVKYEDNADFKAWEIHGLGKNEWVAECGYGGNAEACARLIAATPELLEALKAIISAWEAYDLDNSVGVDEIWKEASVARLIIAKAEGRS